MTATDRLVLGTAQLGMPYGIANKEGRPDPRRAEAIVRAAWEGGIRIFDTAQAYGQSEAILGRIFSAAGFGSAVRIITKLDPNIDHESQIVVEHALEGSLSRLGMERLHGLMLHKEALLDQWDFGLGKTCRSFVRSGRVKYLGVSVYSPHRAIQALGADGIDFVQVPANLLDRRFTGAGVFSEAGRRCKQIFVRSVFLQGLLLMQPEALPGPMGFAKPVLSALSRLAAGIGMPVPEIALCYVRDRFPEARVIFGAETVAQVRENLAWWTVAENADLTARIEESFSDVDETLINPAMWPKGDDVADRGKESEDSQKSVFLKSEGDAWFNRNCRACTASATGAGSRRQRIGRLRDFGDR